MKRDGLESTPAAMNALHDGVMALVLAFTYELSPQRQKSLCAQLQRLAQSKNRRGDALTAAVLLDYAGAADFAMKNPRPKTDADAPPPSG